jgi:RNA polymerase sigma-70 factor (ECF subfamily)
LLAGLKRDDELALDELVRRKTQPLLQVAQRVLGDREEARDVVQMTFLRVWTHRQRYDGSFSPNTWIYRIATNLAIDQLRARRSRERATEPLLQHLRWQQDAAPAGAQRALRDAEVESIFQELAACLTSRQRVIFVLRELEGMASSEVGAIVGCRESTVRNHLFNARAVLRRELLRRYPEYVPAARWEMPESEGEES